MINIIKKILNNLEYIIIKSNIIILVWIKKFYVTFLVLENNITNYDDTIFNFNKEFKDIKFLLTDYNINYIKGSNSDNSNNLANEELTKSLKSINGEIIIDIFPLNTEYKNSNNIIEKNEQIIIIINIKKWLNILKIQNNLALI